MSSPTSSQQTEVFREAAFSIGAQLCRDAIWADSRCNWLGPALENVDGYMRTIQKICGPDLYSGASGIAWFLAHLYQETGELLFATTARAAANLAWSRLDDIAPTQQLSFYTGALGVAYAHVCIGQLLDGEDLVRQGLNWLADREPAKLPAQGLDILSGYAGAVSPLLQLHRRHGEERLLYHALHCGDQLLAAAQKEETGWHWLTMGSPVRPNAPGMLGFSHGAGGIAWALLELAEAAGEGRFREAAEQGFAYERHQFHTDARNWPDNRCYYDASMGVDAQPGFMLAWCHGAPGIGMARLRAHELTADPVFQMEAEMASKVTAESFDRMLVYAEPHNFSLCHGAAGNAELPLLSDQATGRTEHRDLVDKIGRMGLKEYFETRSPWPSGIMGAPEAPGLMLGKAGTGYFYLRLWQPERIPSILLVTPGS